MIFIDLLNNPPDDNIIEEGKRLTEELKQLPDNEKAQFIKDHENYWRDLREYYKGLSHGKCWYTEAKELASPYHMDHFRPKNAVDTLSNNAPCKTINRCKSYWWLAFDWKNYRLSASNPNTRKHTYFPLKENSTIIDDEGDLSVECVGLLDPIKREDVMLLTYDDGGNACAACFDDTSWDAQRVALSVRVYGLNDQSFLDARIQIRRECIKYMERIKAAETERERNNAYDDLNKMMQPDAVLSGVAIDFVRQYKEIYLS